MLDCVVLEEEGKWWVANWFWWFLGLVGRGHTVVIRMIELDSCGSTRNVRTSEYSR